VILKFLSAAPFFNDKTPFCQFHQPNQCAIFVRNFGAKNFKPKIQLSYKILAPKNTLLYKNCPGKMFMKLTPWVYFTNFLRAAFTHSDPKSATVKSQLSFSAREKAAHKTLVKHL